MSTTGLGFNPALHLVGLLCPPCGSHPSSQCGIPNRRLPAARGPRPAYLSLSRTLRAVLTTVLAAKANIVPVCLRTPGPLRPSRWAKSAPLWGQWVPLWGSGFKVTKSLPPARRGGPAPTGPGGRPVEQDSRGGASAGRSSKPLGASRGLARAGTWPQGEGPAATGLRLGR